jgi:hypothetical protein
MTGTGQRARTTSSMACLLAVAVAAAASGAACSKRAACRPGTLRLVVSCGAQPPGVNGVRVSIYDQATPSERKDSDVPVQCPGEASLELTVSNYQPGRVLVPSLTPLTDGASAGDTVTLPAITLAAGCTSATVALPAADGGAGADHPGEADASDGGAGGDGGSTVLDNGAMCGNDSNCASHHCVEGVCCTDTCTGTCMSCLAKNTGGRDGTCANVSMGSDPDNDCTASAQSSCGLTGACDGAGACQYWGTGTACGLPAACSPTQFQPASHCDGHGNCAQVTVTDCSGYGCALPNGCLLTCTTNNDCAPGVSCVNGMCGGKKATGAGCTTGTECALGYCVNSVCCGSPCTTACYACSRATTGLPDGQCQPASGGMDPRGDCMATSSSTCLTTGDCDGAGHCAFWGASASCGTESCNGTMHMPTGICNGQGGCTLPMAQSCGLYACGPLTCNGGCTSDTDCAPNVAYCSGGMCMSKKTGGSPCNADDECGTNHCVDKVCCDMACTTGCYACVNAMTGKPTGQCQPVSSGMSDGTCTVDAPSSCGRTGACDGTGGCLKYPNTTACGAGETCVGTTHTLAGACNGSGTCMAGAQSDCTPYECSGGRCATSCTLDSDCTPQAACTAGKCTPLVCVGDGWCLYNPRPFGGNPTGVWAASATSVWAVGAGIAHWDGTVWSGYPQVSTNKLNDIAGNADGTAWVVGDAGTIARWDGFSWRTVSSGTTQRLADIWITQPSDAWAVGDALLHWDGNQWAPVTTSGAPTSGTQVWASGAGDVYVASSDGLHHLSGSQWTLVSGPWGAGTPALAVGGGGAGDVYAEVGFIQQLDCSLYRWNGSTWTLIGNPICDSPHVSSPGLGEAWVSDPGGDVSHWKNGTLSTVTTIGGGRIFARTATDVWAGFLHGDGTTFTNTQVSYSTDSNLNGVFTIGTSNMWVVGQDGTFKGQAFAWTGATFTPMGLPGGNVMRLESVWASSTTNLWAVGEGPIVLQSTGGTWSSPGGGGTANDFFNGVSGTGVNDIWFVGGTNGRVWHWNGNGMTTTGATVTTGVAEGLLDVVAISPTDVWAVGGSGRVVHYNGASWSTVASGTTQFLQGVCANASNDVWIAGQSGVALHWNGNTLANVSTGLPATDSLHDIWCASATELWAVSYFGNIYRGNGSSWTLSGSPGANVAITGSPTFIWSVGGGGIVVRKAR